MTSPNDRRKAILTSAAELFARKGIAATTVREIADRVGVLSGSLYHHFPSKDAIVSAVVHEYLDELLAAYRGIVSHRQHPRDMVHELVRASLEAAGRHPHATEIYQREQAQLRELPEFALLTDAAVEVKSTWMAALTAGRDQGTFRADVPLWVFYRFLRNTVFHSTPWRQSEARGSIEELAAGLTTMLLDGFARPSDATSGTVARG